MIEIILMELMAITSFLYSLWLMFAFFAPMNELIMVFLWTVGAALIFALAQKKGKVYNLTIILMLLPIRFYSSKSSIFFIIISTIIIFFYIKKSLLKGNHYSYAHTFSQIHLFYIVILYVRLLLDGFSGSVNHAAPFIIIYVLSSILLTRTIRHIDSRMEIEKIRRNNIKYLTIIGLVFIVATFDRLRDSIWGFVSNIFNKLVYALVYPVYLIVQWVMPEKIELNLEASEAIDEFLGANASREIPSGMEPEDIEEMVEGFSRLASIAKAVLILVLIVVLVYILYKTITKAGNRNYVGQGFTEEREYIKRKKKRFGLFNRERYPKEFGEQIRYYYRRYLEKLKKADIEILETDTSLEVNKKAGKVFDERIHDIREIYIKTRYGRKNVDGNMVDEMKNLYRRL